MADRPNIVYIHSHDTGRYIQPYGHAVETPNMQRLAEEGVLFRQNYCMGPTCSPSRAALLSGRCPHANGMLGLSHRGFGMHDYSQHLVHTLRKAGYASALAGVQHITRNPEEIGYDEILPIPGMKKTVRHVAPQAMEYLQRDHDRPFFLSVGFSETHRGFPPPGPFDDPRYTLPPAPLPDTPETRADMAAYKTCVRRYDQGVGMVLDTLREQGLLDNTLVINTTDHGIAFPRMKCTLFDSGIGVMLIMRGPRGFRGGQVCDGLVSHIDLYPTLCDYLGIDRPEGLEGTSFLPMVNGETDSVRDEIFAEINFHAAFDPHRCVRTRRYKYIRRYSGQPNPVLPNTDSGPSAEFWKEHGLKDVKLDREMLFDTIFDPNEANNLADNPDFTEVRDDMRARLERWMEQTDDPIRSGVLKAPKGALLNPPDRPTNANEEREKLAEEREYPLDV